MSTPVNAHPISFVVNIVADLFLFLTVLFYIHALVKTPSPVKLLSSLSIVSIFFKKKKENCCARFTQVCLEFLYVKKKVTVYKYMKNNATLVTSNNNKLSY